MVKTVITQHTFTAKDFDLNKWLKECCHNLSPTDQKLLHSAIDVIKPGQEIETEFGDNLYLRGIQVADIINYLSLDVTCVAAALVYPVFIHYSTIKHSPEAEAIANACLKLSPGVKDLLLELRQVTNIDTTSSEQLSGIRQQSSLQNLRKLLLAVVRDVRVVLLLIADQLSKMRLAANTEVVPEELKLELAEITQDLFVPLANRLGLGSLKWELEDLAFRFLHAKEYRELAALLDEKRIDREQYIYDLTETLKLAMADQNINAVVMGRAKHIYSIWRKMQRKGVGYHQIYDVRAFRVIVNTITECYAALGVVHQLWQPIPNEFDDYIAHPKANGYQSLHTAVVGPQGQNIEIQIRTQAMHEQSELGVAAHWRYKESDNDEIDDNYDQKLRAIRELLEDSEQAEDETDNSSLRDALSEDRIYVFTPKGEVVDLPSGSTPVDFAYSIHTEVGHRCCGAKVDGKMVPLSTILTNGQRIEILTRSNGTPSRDWINPHLNFVRTTRAEYKIRQWFKQQDRPQNIDAGRSLLLRELKRLHLDESLIEQTWHHFKSCSNVDDLYAGIGNGDIRTNQVLGYLQRNSELRKVPNIHHKLATAILPEVSSSEVVIEGVGNLVCHLARCCRPLPGEQIIGYITQGSGVSIHRQDCLNILRADENKRRRFIEVSWGHETRNLYLAELEIRAYDRRGLLSDITGTLSASEVNVIRILTYSDKATHMAHMKLTCEVPSLEILSRVLSRIAQIKNVVSVKRITSG